MSEAVAPIDLNAVVNTAADQFTVKRGVVVSDSAKAHLVGIATSNLRGISEGLSFTDLVAKAEGQLEDAYTDGMGTLEPGHLLAAITRRCTWWPFC